MKLKQFKILIRFFLFIHLHLFTSFWHYKSHKIVLKITLERKYSEKFFIEKMLYLIKCTLVCFSLG